jgi:4-amino-4-deoxy-L-arabinose transferase-like glycosyltransferase
VAKLDTSVLRHCRGRIGVAVLLLAYVAFAVAYTVSSPLYEPTDELRHVRYVRHLQAYNDLPVQSADGPRAQSHHPPLYYVLGAVASAWVPVQQDVYYEPETNPYWGYRYWETGVDNKNQYLHSDEEHWPFQGIALLVYVVRGLTILIGAGVIWTTHGIGREVFRGRWAPSLVSAAVVAFNPQFLYLSGAVNNDIAATLFGAAVALVCVRMVRKGSVVRSDLLLGVLYGLACLTKLHLAALLIPIELAHILSLRRDRDWVSFLRSHLIVLGLAAGISGWWFWRNLVLYGDLTGMAMVNELWEGRPAWDNLWAIRQSLPYLWTSLCGRFGYGQVPLPGVLYQGLFVAALAVAMGYLVPRRGGLRPAQVGVLVAAMGTFALVVFYYILIQPAGAMGRFLFPALPAASVIMAGGLDRLVPRSNMNTACLVVVVGLIVLASYALGCVLAPAFAKPGAVDESEIGRLSDETAVEFVDLARLESSAFEPATLAPGGTVDVTLYWRPLTRTEQDYVVFIHLLSDEGTIVAQRDSYPGLGKNPTSDWDPGVIFEDTFQIQLPETAYAPDAGVLRAGLYLPGGARVRTSVGGDAAEIGRFKLAPRAGSVPNPMRLVFADKAALVGYSMDRRVSVPGETVHLTLYWEELSCCLSDYGVFAHVVGESNQVWASDDGVADLEPAPAGEPSGRVAKDVRELTLGETTPVGLYELEIGLYDAEWDRLPIVAEDGHWIDDRVLLSQVRVEAGD